MTDTFKNPLRRFRELGDTFTYLGINMVVVSFYEAHSLAGRNMPHRLEAEYVSAKGKIVSKIFTEQHLIALYRQNSA